MESTVTQDLDGHSLCLTEDDVKTEYNLWPVLEPLMVKEEPELSKVKLEIMTDGLLDIEEHQEIEDLHESIDIKYEPTSPPGTPTHSTTLDNITSQLDQVTHESSKTQLQFDYQQEVYVKRETNGDSESHTSIQDDSDTVLAVKYQLKTCFVYVSRSDSTDESSKTQRQQEVYIKRELKVNKCPACNKVFSRSRYLQQHLLTHSNKRDHKCGECGKSFKSKTNLWTHKVSHKQGKYVCADCNKTFTHKYHLAQHINNQHMRERDRIRNECSICSKSYSRNFELISHLKTHNLQYCEICNLECDDLHSLRTHMKVAHKGETKHRCGTCEKFFITLEGLTRHEKRHTKLFKCIYCYKRFLTNFRLELHVKNQHPTQYDCDVCSKSFITKEKLTQHKLNHKKPFLCDICNQSFSRSFSLQRHKSKHHPAGVE